jgi:hypothetical protein
MIFAFPANAYGPEFVVASAATTKPQKGRVMRLERAQIWRCINQACGAEVQVLEPSGLAGDSNPRCICGSIMKMPYSRPQLRRFEATEEVKRLLQQLSVVLR